MQNAKCKIQNAKCKMQNAKCKMQNAKFKIYSILLLYHKIVNDEIIFCAMRGDKSAA